MTDTKCCQCDKPAFLSIANNPLCIDHYLKFQQANQIEDARYANHLNFLMGEMEATVGLGPTLQRYKVPQPIIHQGPMKFQNINIDKSNIGFLNTGEIEKLDMTMSVINTTGHRDLTEAFKEFTEAVIKMQELDDKIKKEIVEQITFLANQVVVQKEQKKPSVVKSVNENHKGNFNGLSGSSFFSI